MGKVENDYYVVAYSFDLDETITVGAYLTACSLAAGELPQAELDDLTRESPKLRDLIAAIADEIKAKGDAITPSIHLDRSLRIADWSRLSAAANFLKHADKDAETHLSLNKINNDEILVRAISAYVSIFRQPSDILHQRPYILHQTPAMSAFHIWWMSRHDPDQLRQEYGAEFAEVFQRLSPSRRRRACLKLIRLFTRERSESHAPLVVLSR